jgi:mono/diheme cytochrome c family protein
MKKTFLLLAALIPIALHAADFTADSERGQQLFTSLSCIQCHSVNGRGGSLAPDLGKIADRDFTPASLTATLWNHAPKMWSAMQERDIHAGDLTPQNAADLLAFFYAARFFDRPGDAGRGIRLFSEKHCAECHGLRTSLIPEAKPVVQWNAMYHPIALVDDMWNHAATMREQFAKRKWGWPELTPQDLSDILVYLRNPASITRPPATPGAEGALKITSGAQGKQIFDSKGCAQCHHSAAELSSHLRHMNLTDLAAAMWNHAPKMAATPPQFSLDEMRDLISYLWAQQFFEDAGNPAAGHKVFESKHCASCHQNGTDGAPKLPSASVPINGPAMISALWRHGPTMMHQMNSKHIAWPAFNTAQMSNLIAYLNSAASSK